MKEQWKKLDSDSKLLVNVEEGRSLPIKIELPVSAFVSTKDNCCAKLLTVLRIVVLLVLLIFLTWFGIFFYTPFSSRVNLDFDQNEFINTESAFDEEKTLPFKNALNEPLKADKLSLNEVDTTDSIQQKYSHSSNIKDSFIPVVSESTFTSKSDYISKLDFKKFHDVTDKNLARGRWPEPMTESVEISKMWQELKNKIKVIEEMYQFWDQENNRFSEEKMNLRKEFDSFAKTIDQIIRGTSEINELVKNDENENSENRLNVVNNPQESSIEIFENEQEELESIRELINVLFQVMNSMGFDEQVKNENESDSFEKLLNSNIKVSSVEKILEDKNIFEQQEKDVSTETNTNEKQNFIGLDIKDYYPHSFKSINEKVNTPLYNEKIVSKENLNNFARENDLLDYISKFQSNGKFATFMAKYLEPVVGQNKELLVWYYLNKNNPDFLENNAALKVFTARLLYSTNIIEYSSDVTNVLNALMNEVFAENLKLLLEGGEEMIELTTNVEARIIDRIVTKLKMNKLIRECRCEKHCVSKRYDKFSKMIETNNRMELAQLNLDHNDMKKIFIQSEFFKNTVEAGMPNLWHLTREIAKDDTFSIEDLKVFNDCLPWEDSKNDESQENLKKVIDAMKKVALDDVTIQSVQTENNEETVAITTEDTPENGLNLSENENEDESNDGIFSMSEKQDMEIVTPEKYPTSEIQNTNLPSTNQEVTENNNDNRDMSSEKLESDEELDITEALASLINIIKTGSDEDEENKNMNDYLSVYGDLYDY